MTGAASRRDRILDRIARAAALSRRDPADVTLIAVTKGRSADEIQPLIAAGHRNFGESRVQEALEKWPPLLAGTLLVGAWEAGGQLLALPAIPDAPLDITTLSRDPDVGADYDKDPLVWHGPFKRPTLEAIDAGLAAIEAGPALGSLPLMWAHGEAD